MCLRKPYERWRALGSLPPLRLLNQSTLNNKRAPTRVAVPGRAPIPAANLIKRASDQQSTLFGASLSPSLHLSTSPSPSLSLSLFRSSSGFIVHYWHAKRVPVAVGCRETVPVPARHPSVASPLAISRFTRPVRRRPSTGASRNSTLCAQRFFAASRDSRGFLGRLFEILVEFLKKIRKNLEESPRNLSESWDSLGFNV